LFARHDDAELLSYGVPPDWLTAIRAKLRRLIGDQPRMGERLEVQSLDAIARRLHDVGCKKRFVR
jgi:hypothetical protein